MDETFLAPVSTANMHMGAALSPFSGALLYVLEAHEDKQTQMKDSAG